MAREADRDALPGAFEVYYNGEEVFSKLKSGQIPQVHDIVSEIGRRRETRS